MEKVKEEGKKKCRKARPRMRSTGLADSQLILLLLFLLFGVGEEEEEEKEEEEEDCNSHVFFSRSLFRVSLSLSLSFRMSFFAIFLS